MVKKEQSKTDTSKAALQTKTGVPQVRGLANVGLGTSRKVDGIIDAIVHDMALDLIEPDKSRLLLSAVGKKLTLENMKIKAGFYRDKANQGFLSA